MKKILIVLSLFIYLQAAPIWSFGGISLFSSIEDVKQGFDVFEKQENISGMLGYYASRNREPFIQWSFFFNNTSSDKPFLISITMKANNATFEEWQSIVENNIEIYSIPDRLGEPKEGWPLYDAIWRDPIKEFEGFQTVYSISFNKEAKILVINLVLDTSQLLLQHLK